MSLREALFQFTLTVLVLLAVAELMHYWRSAQVWHRLWTFLRTGSWRTL